MSELVLICGWPGSGKTTKAKEEYPKHWLVEADMYFMNEGEYKFNPEKLPHAHGWCRMMADKLLDQGMKVVVCNTFTRKHERKPYIEMAKKKNIPYKVVFCDGNYENVHDVPEDVVQKMKERMNYEVE